MQGCAICRGQWSRFEWGGLNFWAEVLLQYCHICEASHTKRPKYFFTPKLYLTNSKTTHYPMLVYTTQVNSTFRAHWLASSEVLFTKYYSPPSSRRKTKYLFNSCSIFTNLVTLLAASYSACVVYTKTIIHLSVGESGGYLPPLQWIIVNIA